MLESSQSATLSKKKLRHDTGVFLYILLKFYEHFLWNTSTGSFWMMDDNDLNPFHDAAESLSINRSNYVLRPARWSWCRLVRSTKAMYKKRECTYEQKQPPEVFCVKRVHRNLTKLTGKHLCQSLFFNKVVNFVKFLRTPFFQNTSGRLLLYETKSETWNISFVWNESAETFMKPAQIVSWHFCNKNVYLSSNVKATAEWVKVQFR